MTIQLLSPASDSPQWAKIRDPNKKLPPAIILGGNDNALSIVRSLGRRGIPVHVLNKPDSDVAHSYYARPITLASDQPFEEAAIQFLRGSPSEFLRGSVLLAASDEALTLIADNRQQLAERFRLDLSNREAQRRMLDKLTTYHIAEQADVPTPKFWEVQSKADLFSVQSELVFPVIIKPVHSHLFQQKFRSKFLIAENFQELCEAFRIVEAAKIEIFLVEKIPGPDSALCSYYTYLDEQGSPLFDFTKRIIRRFPVNMGLATYHVTDHVDGVKEPALRLFQHAGLRGLANAEFKYDRRDGKLKLIECNARFTAANGLVTRAGIDLGSLVYNRIVGLPLPPLDHFKAGLTLWDPLRDLKALGELRTRGEITFFQWARSVMRLQQFPSFAWSDPKPAIARLVRRFRS